MADVHRITITNTISQLKKEGLIGVDADSFIEVLNWNRVKQLSFSECI